MRSLTLDQLRAFVEVVERGGFTAAARELNLTQPAVTHQVQETGAALPGDPGGAFRQAGLPDRSGREIDRTRSKSVGRRLAHASDDAPVRRWMARSGTRRHEYDRAHVFAAANPATA